MKRSISILLLLLFCTIVVSAQDNKRFDAARFEAELEQFIVTDAFLSPDEASRFFPLYREMRNKQREIQGEDKKFHHFDRRNDKECEEMIRRRDDRDIEMKELLKEYHEKFMRILPASKVYQILQSEEKFHRRLFKRAVDHDEKK